MFTKPYKNKRHFKTVFRAEDNKSCFVFCEDRRAAKAHLPWISSNYHVSAKICYSYFAKKPVKIGKIKFSKFGLNEQIINPFA